MPRTPTSLMATGALTGLLAIGALATSAASPAPEVGSGQDRSAQLAARIDPAEPKSVILLIGDGMDDSMITAARDYALGADGRFALDSLPFTGAMTTHGLKVGPGPDYPVAYVSDSAPTASGWSTGRKTVDGRLSQGPSTATTVPGEDYRTVLEQFQEAGKLTGDITTSEITDATPAAAAAHINARACKGPTDMTSCLPAKKSNGGKGSIAEQLVDHEVDVLLGGGMSSYTQSTDAGGGETVLSYAQQEHGYRVLQDEHDLAAVTSLEDGPVLGLFAPANLTPMNDPLVATPPPGAGSATTECTPADRGDQPDLSTMTRKAIELLDNPDGFFLQAESAMIDKQEHATDICGAIGDLVELDEAVRVALDYQAEHPDTLIIVTGDHAHSTQIVGGSGDGKLTATLRTADGDPLTVAYSTSDTGSDHTGAQIRVAASGPQAANVTGVIDQTDLYATMLGRTPSTLPGPGQPQPLAPQAAVASPPALSRGALRRAGLPVSVAAAGSTKVTVHLLGKGRVLASRKVGREGGDVRLRTRRTVTGQLVVKVVATGPGGSDVATRRVRITR
ncbi:alkaline phosphatase [Nocardioides sp. cx-169]|uniref:alkaline phosphatase n=1 Tax=Nocardioides sp. cx-169 TaxID=2899080 RepID=UPI001E377B73|nr:alkaline phosphatase [Nocardioides sp. cx-169]MCD4534481.1 alkaline phosphatase [Nocardioides sp. cx-169]